MHKRIIAITLSLLGIINSLPCAVASADADNTASDKLYCLTDNMWTDRDVEIYKNYGVDLENYKTGAEYSWTKDSDTQIKEQDAYNSKTGERQQSKGNQLTGGNLSDTSGDCNIWSTWNKVSSATAVFDLKDIYWVSQVDAWSLTTTYAQTGVINVRVGETLDKMKSLPSQKSSVPDSKELINAGGKLSSYASVKFNASRIRYIEVTFNTPERATNSSIPQMIVSEVAVFGYTQKPEISEYVEEQLEEAKTVYEKVDPELNDRLSYVTDLGAVYEITGTNVTQYNSSANGLESYDIYLSSDGENYSYIQNAEAQNTIDYQIAEVSSEIRTKIYARYVKFVMHKQSNKSGVLVKKIEVYGRDGVEQKRIDENATYSYYTQNPYRTADDIRLDDRDCTVLMDGDKEHTVSTSEEWATIVVDLKEAYQVGDVNIYSLAGGKEFLEGCEIRYSLDGKKFFSYTYYVNKNDKNSGIVKSTFSGMPGRYARFLKIICQSADSKIALSEIEINGYPVKMTASSKPAQVPLRVEMKNYLLAYLDWSTYNEANASKFAVYIEKEAFTDTAFLKPVAEYESFDDAFKYKYTTYTGLEPEETYYFAVTPFDSDGNEITKVSPVKITTEGVLEDRPRDIFCIVNHPGYNGGATKKFGSYTSTMKLEAARLMDEMGTVNCNRDWQVTSDMETYRNIGISTMWPGAAAAQSSMANAMKLSGTYMFSNGNERDLQKEDTVKFFNEMKASYAKVKSLSKKALLVNPVLGGTEAGSLDWFDSLYKAGNGTETRLNYDAVDVHLYPKLADKTIEGVPASAPEILPLKIESVRNVLRKYGDESKPIITTEIGYLTSDKNGYQPALDYDTQRDWVVRSYLILISEGIRKAWHYDFQDDGLDFEYLEHNWGLIDYFGVPKPSYYGYYNLSQQMRYAELIGAVPGLTTPYYGFEFFDETKNRKMSVIWAADGQTKTMQFDSLSGEDELIEVIGTDGGFDAVKTENGKGTVTIGSAPIFIYSEKGVKPTSIDVAFKASNSEFNAIMGSKINVSLARQRLANNLSGYVEAANLPSGWSIDETTFNASQKTVDTVINIPENAAEGTQTVTLEITTENGAVTPIKISINVKPAVEVNIVPEPVNKDDWSSWRLAAYCTNVVQQPVNVKVSLVATSGIEVEMTDAPAIDNLMPGETRAVYFNVKKPAEEFGAVGSFIISTNGNSKSFDRNLNFSACVNDGITPVIDGEISSGEWDNCQVIMQQSYRQSSWEGEDDLSFKIYRKWDEKNFYFAADVTDDVYCQPYQGTDIWNGDCIQFALDVKRKNGVATDAADYFEIGLTKNNKETFEAWVWIADLIVKKERPLTGIDGIVKHTDDGHTIYEVAIPWTFFIENGAVNEYDCFGFAAVVNDNDGKNRKGWLKYMQGIADGKDPSWFEDMVLIKK
ncbi:MAG: discoidin domain-containing protein [Clostridiales bacterium]|nr:discoidin domain-containing protein [Clostridiales bacterium]